MILSSHPLSPSLSFRSSSTFPAKMLSLKVLFVSAAVIFAALGLKASLPVASTYLPLFWSFFLLCSTPPYLFVILNAIIISIVASSKLQHSNHQPEKTPPPQLHPPLPPSIPEENTALTELTEEEDEEKKVIREGIAASSPAEKPLVSARFSHRKFLKSTSEGGRATLRVVAKAKAKRQETLESTWKAITEGRSMPLSRHMKKCDTWQSRNVEPSSENKYEETLTVAAGKLRKEPSLSQDELNRRVEAFINKFNEEMRLQRQQSLEQYMQMINRGAA
ncbi:hypothetical protein Fmac_009888 [Flemingia macrophylla]|uniref:DUF4408 domain-containing protein n=1 Tax=Flemingia macrophylla TaxID=520843 RepID=A0ABD1N1M9_9FABA